VLLVALDHAPAMELGEVGVEVLERMKRTSRRASSSATCEVVRRRQLVLEPAVAAHPRHIGERLTAAASASAPFSIPRTSLTASPRRALASPRPA
jgi:hypothetical protein